MTIAGIVLAVIRLLTASRAFWWKFPEWAQKGLPALLVALGTIPVAIEHATSWLQIAEAGLLAIGAWFTASRGDKRPVQKPGAPALPLLTFVIAFSLGTAISLAACSGQHVNWPKVLSCGEKLEQPLIEAVAKVLTGTGDVKSELDGIAVEHGPGVVECAVQQIVSDMASGPTTARASRAAERGRAFLRQVQQ
jgi:predicted PurR-regulated permease PerM